MRPPKSAEAVPESMPWVPITPIAQPDSDDCSQSDPVPIALSSGKVVLLDFWVDWCPYCRDMYPHEKELAEQHADRGFVILGVNGDEPTRLKNVEARGTVTWR